MDYALIQPINEEYSPLEQVLTNRGIQLEDIPHYLKLDASDNLSPSLLANIDDAVKMLLTHLNRPDGQIFVVVDSDCDGYTSSAVLLNYIYEVFPSAINKISYMLHDGKVHGIELDKIPAGTTLVIAPDSSSNEYDIHKELKKQGIDVLVLDHHEADQVSQYACVVNNQLCDYPNKTLSGVGIVYKLCQRIDEIMGEQHADNFLDLVSTGLIGDMMDIRNMETRYLISCGFNSLRNPFVKGMTNKNSYSLKGELTPIGVAFYIVPLVNAVTRVGTQDEKQVLFDSMLEWKAYKLVPSTKRGCSGQEEQLIEQALRVCTNVKSRQTRLQDAAVETIERLIADAGLLEHKLLIVCLDEAHKIDPGITGLIANKLMAKYQRPVALLNKFEREDGVYYSGSARGYDKSRMKDFRSFVLESELSVLAQGHANAFGISFKEENIPLFLEYSDKKLADFDFTPSYRVDYIGRPQTFNPQIILDLGEHKELWGQNMEEPLIAIEHIQVTKDMVTLMSRDKNPTLKIQLPNGVSCIKFKSSEEEYEEFLTEQGCVTINLVGKPEVNRYYSSITPQLIITDYEIINKQKFYF